MILKAIRKEKEYIPEFNGNRKLPKEEQIIVKFKDFPNVSQAKKYKTYRYSQDAAVEMIYNDGLFLMTHVDSIKNLNDGFKEIKTGADLSTSENLQLEELTSELREYALEQGENLKELEK